MREIRGVQTLKRGVQFPNTTPDGSTCFWRSVALRSSVSSLKWFTPSDQRQTGITWVGGCPGMSASIRAISCVTQNDMSHLSSIFCDELITTTGCKVRPPSRWARARGSILTKFANSLPDSFTSRMKSVVTPVVQVSSRLETYSTASHFTYISQSHKIALPVASVHRISIICNIFS